MDRRTFLHMAGAGTAFGAIGLAASRASVASAKGNGVGQTAVSSEPAGGLNAPETAIVPLKLVNNGFDLELTTGDVPGLNLIDVTKNDEAFVNLGLIPFFRYGVVFDVERGLVGFAPCAA